MSDTGSDTQIRQTQTTILERVEKLLAKAASTEFEAEAQAFYGKAQSLMSQWAISEAMLRTVSDAADVEITSITIDVSTWQYSKAKAKMIGAVCEANEASCIFKPWGHVQRGKRGYYSVDIYGTPWALDRCKLLIDSLAVQLDDRLINVEIPEGVHGKTFRQNYTLGFAEAIGYRLSEAKRDETDKVPGSALVLVDEAKKAMEGLRRANPTVSTGVVTSRGSAGRAQGYRDGQNASLASGVLK